MRLPEELPKQGMRSKNNNQRKNIRFCKGCLACQKTQHCVINDDAPAIVAKMHDADVIVFATPIYYYEMCGQLKTLLDRANPLYSSDYHFRDIYMLTSAAEDEEYVPERAVAGLTGWIDCFEKPVLQGQFSPEVSVHRVKRKGILR